jgi:hypothetical protein
LGERLVYGLKVLVGYQGSQTQKTSKHLKEGRVLRNRKLYEGGRKKSAS